MALHAACLILLFLILTINQSIAWALPTLLSWSRWPVIHYLSLKARSHIPTRLSLAQPIRWSQTVQLYSNYLGMSHTTTRPSDRYRTRRLYKYLPIEILTVVLLILKSQDLRPDGSHDKCYNPCSHIPVESSWYM